VAKKKLVKSEHGIIYTGKKIPETNPAELPRVGERGMQPYAIRVEPDLAGTKLYSMSRIDYAKVQPIDYNQKSKNYGMVNSSALVHLLQQWKSVISMPSSKGISLSGSTAAETESVLEEQRHLPETRRVKDVWQSSDQIHALGGVTVDDIERVLGQALLCFPSSTTGDGWKMSELDCGIDRTRNGSQNFENAVPARSREPTDSEEQKFYIMHARILWSKPWPCIEDEFTAIFGRDDSGRRSQSDLKSMYHRTRQAWGLEEFLEDGIAAVHSRATSMAPEFLGAI
jgi:hypothetical protein